MEKVQEKGASREIKNFFGAGIGASAAVLVGGQSRRMGLNKAFLKIGPGRLIENITAKLKTLFPEVLLAGSDPEPYVSLGLPVVSDVYRGCGPLAGIHAALTAAANPYVFIMACDLPFVDLDLIAFLVKNAPGYDAVVPRLGAYLEPLCAVRERLPEYHRSQFK
jgi:Molybdopterin-guanine dinucleotide biosynthesis protein A